MVRLEHWSFVSNDWRGARRDPTWEEFQAPVPGSCLFGRVTGHPRIEDGHRAHTSKVDHFSKNVANPVITTTGTKYELGEVNPLYEDWMIENGWNCMGRGWF